MNKVLPDDEALPLDGGGLGGGGLRRTAEPIVERHPTQPLPIKGRGLSPRRARRRCQRLAAISDTPRLDAELLMAHALGIEREDLLLGRLDDAAPPAFDASARAPPRARAGRLYHRPPRLLDDRARGRARRARPAPGQRDPDRGRGRAFRRCAGRRASSISAPAPARCCSPRSTNGPRRPGSASMLRPRRSLMRGAMPSGGRAAFRLGDWGEGIDGEVRPHPVQPALCRSRRRAAARRRPLRAARPRFSPAPTGSTPIARSRRNSPRLLAPGGIVCLEIGAGQQAAVSALMAAAGFTIESRTRP